MLKETLLKAQNIL